jgi:hypothetical protein
MDSPFYSLFAQRTSFGGQEPDLSVPDNPYEALTQVRRPTALSTPQNPYEVVRPHEQRVIDSMAGQARKKFSMQSVTAGAKQGFTLREQAQIAEEQALRDQQRQHVQGSIQEAMQRRAELAQTILTMPQEEHNKLRAILEEMMLNPPQRPGRPDLEQPTDLQMLAAAIGSLLSPEFAFGIGAAPFQQKLQDQQREYDDLLAEYDVTARQHQMHLGMVRDDMSRADHTAMFDTQQAGRRIEMERGDLAYEIDRLYTELSHLNQLDRDDRRERHAMDIRRHDSIRDMLRDAAKAAQDPLRFQATVAGIRLHYKDHLPEDFELYVEQLTRLVEEAARQKAELERDADLEKKFNTALGRISNERGHAREFIAQMMLAELPEGDRRRDVLLSYMPEIRALSPLQQQQLASAKRYDSMAKLLEEKAKTEPETRKLILANTTLRGNQAAHVAAQTWWLPHTAALQIARGYAQIDDIYSGINNRTFNQEYYKANFDLQGRLLEQGPIRVAMDQIAKSAVTERGLQTHYLDQVRKANGDPQEMNRLAQYHGKRADDLETEWHIQMRKLQEITTPPTLIDPRGMPQHGLIGPPASAAAPGAFDSAGSRAVTPAPRGSRGSYITPRPKA